MINWNKKTMKREYALVLLLVLLYEVVVGNSAMVEIIVWPFLSFVATAAGLTIYDRQGRERYRNGGQE